MSTQPIAPAQFITFTLGAETFAVNVSQVREVLELSLITRVPGAPDCMRGVVNVRGKAVPVADLRAKFGLAHAADTINSRILVMELEIDGDTVVVGGIADSVQEVVELDAAQVSPPPRIGLRWRSEVIEGMARRGEDFVIILDLGAVFSLDDLRLPASEAA